MISAVPSRSKRGAAMASCQPASDQGLQCLPAPALKLAFSSPTISPARGSVIYG
jgi:hypothetical protein